MEFEKLSHCPTAIHCPTLDYEEDGKKIEVTLLGNPTSFGPNFNSCEQGVSNLMKAKEEKKCVTVRLQALPSSSLRAAKQEARKTIGQDSLRGVVVPEGIIHLNLSASVVRGMTEETEILTFYEKEEKSESDSSPDFFVKFHPNNVYCDRCMGKVARESADDIIFCDFSGCLRGRHQKCWPNNIGPTKEEIDSMSHRCELHIHSRLPRKMPKRTAKDTKKSAEIPKGNFPPIFSGVIPTVPSSRERATQILHPSFDELGLSINCSQLKLEVKQSSVSNAGRGVFASSPFLKGDVVCFFFGTIIDRTRYQEMLNGNIEVPAEFASYMKDAQQGIMRCIDVSQTISDAENEYQILVSPQCPAGYINDPANYKKNGERRKKSKDPNVFVEFPSEFSIDIHGNIPWKTFRVVASTNIPKDTELFLDYKWVAKTWAFVTKHAQPSTPAAVKTRNETPSPFLLGTPPEEVAALARAFHTQSVEDPVKLLEQKRKDFSHEVARRRRLNSFFDTVSSARSIPRNISASSHVASNSAAIVPASKSPLLVTVKDCKGEAYERHGSEFHEQHQQDESASDSSDHEEDGEADERHESAFHEQNQQDESDSPDDWSDADENGRINSDEKDESEDDSKSDFFEENTNAPQRSMMNSKRMSAAADDHQRAKGFRFVLKIRDPEITKTLDDYSKAEFSPSQLKALTEIVEQYAQVNATKFKGKESAGMMLREESSPDRVIKWGNLRHDAAEIGACCGNIKQNIRLPPSHPFLSVEKLLKRRVELIGQGASDILTNRVIMSYMENVGEDPADLNLPKKEKKHRIFTFDGVRSCANCFRAVLGVGRDRLFTVRKNLSKGEHLIADCRNQQFIHKSQDKVFEIVTELQNHIRDEMCEFLPTNEGGENQSFQFAFTQKTDLKSFLEEKLYGEQNQFLPEAEKKKISESSLRRALRHCSKSLNLNISCAKSKKFMKCDSCIFLDNKKKECSKDPRTMKTVQKQRYEHFHQVKTQRDHYQKLRDISKSVA